MNIHINYCAGAGGDFLKICIWLLLHPEIKLDWSEKWNPTKVFHDNPISGCLVNADDGSNQYSLCGLLDDGSIKPATFLSSRDLINFGASSGINDVSIQKIAGLYAEEKNIQIQEALNTLAKAQVKQVKNLSKDQVKGFQHTVVGSHYSFEPGYDTYDINDLYKLVTGMRFHHIFSIVTDTPGEAVLVRHLDRIKNHGTQDNQTINETYNNLKKIIDCMSANIYGKKHAQNNNYTLLKFKEIHCTSALELAEILAKYIKGIKVSDSYLEFHEKYKQLNNIETLLQGNKLKIADDVIREYMKEVDAWLL